MAHAWVKKMVVYNYWTGTCGLEWWMGTVELPVCSFGGQRADVQNLIPLYMALEGPQMAPVCRL